MKRTSLLSSASPIIAEILSPLSTTVKLPDTSQLGTGIQSRLDTSRLLTECCGLTAGFSVPNRLRFCQPLMWIRLFLSKLLCVVAAFLYAPSLTGEVYGVTCFDGSNHPPGFDCQSLLKNKSTVSNPGVPAVQDNSWQMQQIREKADLLRRERERTQVELQEAEVITRQQKSMNRIQFEAGKLKVLGLLKSETTKIGLKDEISTDSDLKVVDQKDYHEPVFSEGSRSSAPVVFKGNTPGNPGKVSPESLKIPVKEEKGLRIEYVPKPHLMALADYDYDNKTRTTIILDALEYGADNFELSINHLQDYLAQINPDSLKVQEALSYIQGMSTGNHLTHSKSNARNPFDPRPDDSQGLLEAIATSPSSNNISDHLLNPPLPNIPIWQKFRDEAIDESAARLQKETEMWTKDDIQACVNILQQQVHRNPNKEGLAQALQFYQGMYVYYTDR